ncbi:MAG: hypothetical protein GY953_10755, partial [bacterium]|nr:hypothetical protein [bacterium]
MLRRLLLILFASAAVLAAEPYIAYRGVVNAASFAPQGLPNGSIARGSIFTIFGRDLGPETFVSPTGFPLQTVLGGVSVTVQQGETTLDALPVFAWNSQLSVIMPSNAPLGTVVVRVSFEGEQSNPAIVEVVESSVGIFALNSGGFGPGVVQNFVTQADQPVNTTRVTARPGQTMIGWGTGLGGVGHADNIEPTPADFPIDVEILVGGRPAMRRYAGRSSCCSG